MTGREFTKILDWPGYRVYRHEIDEEARTLKLWVRRKRGNKVLICSGCGGRCWKIEEIRQRRVRDLPWRKYQTFVVVEFYRVRCPKCGLKVEAVPQLPSKAPFTKDFEDAVGLACESAAARQVARQYGLAAGTVRAMPFSSAYQTQPHYVAVLAISAHKTSVINGGKPKLPGSSR